MDYFDLHCDTLYECFVQKEPLYANDLAVSAKAGGCFDRYIQNFAIWIPDDADRPFDLYRKVYNNALTELAAADTFELIDAKIPQKPGIYALFAVEGGRLLEGDVLRLDILRRDGVKMLTLTWNAENELAFGAACRAGGLKPFGREVIERMNWLGMVCDLSHLNKESFWDALPLCRYPCASHSCFDEINRHQRNLTEEQFAALIDGGGLMGLCLYPEFLGSGDVFEQVYRHIAYGLEHGGENALAVGSDFDGAVMDENLNGTAKIPKLYNYLRCKGINNAVLEKIFYKNAAEFYTNVLTNPAV